VIEMEAPGTGARGTRRCATTPWSAPVGIGRPGGRWDKPHWTEHDISPRIPAAIIPSPSTPGTSTWTR